MVVLFALKKIHLFFDKYNKPAFIISSTIYIVSFKTTVISTQNIQNRAPIKSAPCSTPRKKKLVVFRRWCRKFRQPSPKAPRASSLEYVHRQRRRRRRHPPSISSPPFAHPRPLHPTPLPPFHHHHHSGSSTHENSSCRAATSLFAGRSAKRGDLSVRTKNRRRWVWVEAAVEVCYRKGYVRRVRASLFWCCSRSTAALLVPFACYVLYMFIRGKNIYKHATHTKYIIQIAICCWWNLSGKIVCWSLNREYKHEENILVRV